MIEPACFNVLMISEVDYALFAYLYMISTPAPQHIAPPGLYYGSVMTLQGSTFPVLLTNDNNHAIMAAARVSQGRAVMFNMEDYIDNCYYDTALCSGDPGGCMGSCAVGLSEG